MGVDDAGSQGVIVVYRIPDLNLYKNINLVLQLYVRYIYMLTKCCGFGLYMYIYIYSVG